MALKFATAPHVAEDFRSICELAEPDVELAAATVCLVDVAISSFDEF